MSLPVDRMLASVLQLYLITNASDHSERIYADTTSLLVHLHNPRNVTLVTSHFLAAPAIWDRPDGLRTCQRIMTVYNMAAIAVAKRERVPPARDELTFDAWVRAVIRGADERSPRWRHGLVIAGVLIGMSRHGEQLSSELRYSLESAACTAANLALESSDPGDLASGAVVLALNYAFPHLRDDIRSNLAYDALLAPLLRGMLGIEGYQDGYFVAIIDPDIEQVTDAQFDWPATSISFQQLQRLSGRPLVTSMGPLSKLAGEAILRLTDPTRVLVILDELQGFSGNVLQQWRRNKLSEIDASEDAIFITREALQTTVPVLWQVLKGMMFAVVNILRAVSQTTLLHRVLSSDQNAVSIATKTLHILRNLYFVAARLGTNFSALTFAHLASIDIITRYPRSAKDFLVSIAPPYLGTIPSHPLDRNLDLFFLNTSEHFTLALSSADNESLIFAAASPYINPEVQANLLELFEAAHSAVLAMLAAYQNTELASRIIPFYVEALLRLFPQSLSAKQFRFAFKTLVQITTPPAPLASFEPDMAETLLELLRHRALSASTSLLGERSEEQALTEQAVLILTLIDSLPQLRPLALEEWLSLTAELVDSVQDVAVRDTCRNRFWEALQSGEMDVERAAICVGWWTGKPNLLEDEAVMSGGLGTREGSRL